MLVLLLPEDKFRERLVAMEQENIELRRRLASVEGNANNRDSECDRLQRRVRSLEKANEQLNRNNNQIEREKRTLEKKVSTLHCFYSLLSSW